MSIKPWFCWTLILPLLSFGQAAAQAQSESASAILSRESADWKSFYLKYQLTLRDVQIFGKPTETYTTSIQESGEILRLEDRWYMRIEQHKPSHKSVIILSLVGNTYTSAIIDNDRLGVIAVIDDRAEVSRLIGSPEAYIPKSIRLSVFSELPFVRIPAPDALLQSKPIVIQPKSTDANSCLIETKWGNFTLTTSVRPSISRRLINLLFEKTGTDFVSLDQRFGDLLSRDKTPYRSYRLDLYYNYLTADVDAVPQLESIRYDERLGVESNPKYSDHQELLKIDQLDFSPKEPSEYPNLILPIPNGTRVSVQNRRGINYEWRDGSIQKVVDRPAVASVEKNRFQESSGLGFWLWVLVAIGILSLGLALVFRRKSRSET